MTQKVKQWKILDLLKTTEELFRQKNISGPRLNAELLLSDTLNLKKIDLYLYFDKPLNITEIDSFREKVKRRLNGEPLQYITGNTGFYGLTFKVNSSVLIPRQETELLVDKVLEYIETNKLENPNILEIGTGSGCISVAVASKINCKIDAIDISKSALNTAQDNSSNNPGAGRINFLQKDILTDYKNFNEYDIVISNPPYIPADEIPGLQIEIKNFEPVTALTDNGDGMTFYRKILELWKETETNNILLIEIGDGKSVKVESLLSNFGITGYTIHKDFLNINRVLQV